MKNRQSRKHGNSKTLVTCIKSNKARGCMPMEVKKQAESKIAYFNKKMPNHMWQHHGQMVKEFWSQTVLP